MSRFFIEVRHVEGRNGAPLAVIDIVEKKRPNDKGDAPIRRRVDVVNLTIGIGATESEYPPHLTLSYYDWPGEGT